LIGAVLQVALQLAALPVSVSMVHGWPSSHDVGHVPGGSHVSPGSTMPLPHEAGQSLSASALHPAGQQPSLFLHATGEDVHLTLHVAELPLRTSLVQALPSLHDVGHEPAGSQVSPESTTPLPQAGPQSTSPGLQPGTQQPSPPVQAVTVLVVQRAVQVADEPTRVSVVQALPSLHELGHDPGGSHVSPASTAPLPHLTVQSESVSVLQPAGQQPSAPRHAVTA